MLSVRLPPDIEKRLEALAKASGQSTADVVLAAILDYLDDLDDAALAEQRLAELANGTSDTVSLADLISGSTSAHSCGPCRKPA